MSASPTNRQAEQSLRVTLRAEGFTLSPEKKRGETGPDIIATKGALKYYIEVIGYKEHGSAHSEDFYEVFFRTVSRLNKEVQHCVMAMPKQFRRGFPQRIVQHRVAWQRIGAAFPELEIWLVDTVENSYEAAPWSLWSKKVLTAPPE